MDVFRSPRRRTHDCVRRREPFPYNCTFSITDDSGRRVSSIPPGTYQVSIRTPVSFAEVDLSGILNMQKKP